VLHAATGGKIRAPKQALHNTHERKHSAQAQMHRDFASSNGNLPDGLLCCCWVLQPLSKAMLWYVTVVLLRPGARPTPAETAHYSPCGSSTTTRAATGGRKGAQQGLRAWQAWARDSQGACHEPIPTTQRHRTTRAQGGHALGSAQERPQAGLSSAARCCCTLWRLSSRRCRRVTCYAGV